MKIATLTTHRPYNYGAALQSYALQKYLKECGYDTELIDYIPSYFRRKLSAYIIRCIDMIRCRYVFHKFLKNHIELTKRKYRSVENLKKAEFDYDAFIVGSDQVWNMNMNNGKDDAFFLSFVDEDRLKISYAASIAMDYISAEQFLRFKSLTSDYTAVSVRERSNAKMLTDKGITCEQVCDPVYLLSKEEWRKISTQKKQKNKYVLVYAFYNQKDVYDYAEEYAKKYDLKLYYVTTCFFSRLSLPGRQLWCPNITEFIGLIDNAQMVITNSFHGLAFSLIFNKPVSVFKTNKKGNNRITDMLFSVGIEEQEKNCIAEITDYTKINPKLNVLIEKSKDFLEKSINKK